MSRTMHARGGTALAPRTWPSMAAASAGISRSSRTPLGRARAGTAVLSLIGPEPVETIGGEAQANEYVAHARFEGEIVVTLSPKGDTGEPITLTIPIKATVTDPERLMSAGSVEE